MTWTAHFGQSENVLHNRVLRERRENEETRHQLVSSTAVVQQRDVGDVQTDASDLPSSRTSSGRNKLQQASGAATPGSLGPPLRSQVFGSPPFCVPTPTLVREFLFLVTRNSKTSLFGLPARELRVSPLCHSVGSWVAALPFVPPLPSDRIPLTQSPRREVATGPATQGVPTPRLLASLNGGVVSAGVPALHERWRCSRSRTLWPFEVTL